MHTRQRHPNDPVHVMAQHALLRRQTRRRRLLGIGLIVVGMVCLWLRVTGLLDDQPAVSAVIAAGVAGAIRVDSAFAVPLAACGMLTAYAIRRGR